MAFRKGIKAHHFGRNILPLEKLKHSINLRLALKGIVHDLRSNIGVGICIITAGIAVMFAVYTFDFFKNGHDGLMSVMGMEIPDISLMTINGVDNEAFCEELRQMPEVDKVLINCALGNNVEVKGSAKSSTAVVYKDFSLTENIHVKTGRFPEYENEIMITTKREKDRRPPYR
ncbi:MAG: hypothetical protein IJ740_04855 [Ruminococcus sp.]|nr:hypothetical protein [Ruminococcus sp.]